MTSEALEQVVTDYKRLVGNPDSFPYDPLTLPSKSWISDRDMIAAILVLAGRIDELVHIQNKLTGT